VGPISCELGVLARRGGPAPVMVHRGGRAPPRPGVLRGEDRSVAVDFKMGG
jgi:hypothetical protein